MSRELFTMDPSGVVRPLARDFQLEVRLRHSRAESGFRIPTSAQTNVFLNIFLDCIPEAVISGCCEETDTTLLV